VGVPHLGHGLLSLLRGLAVVWRRFHPVFRCGTLGTREHWFVARRRRLLILRAHSQHARVVDQPVFVGHVDRHLRAFRELHGRRAVAASSNLALLDDVIGLWAVHRTVLLIDAR